MPRNARTASGERLQQLINVTPLRLACGTGCTLQIHDVSLSVQRERKLREQADALEASHASLQPGSTKSMRCIRKLPL